MAEEQGRIPTNKSLGFRSRMVLSFGALFALTVVGMLLLELYGLPGTGLRGEMSRLRSEEVKDLDLVANLKKERLMRWLEERRDNVAVLAQSTVVGSQVLQLGAVMRDRIAAGSEGDELWTAVRQEQVFRDLVQHLNVVKSSYGVYDSIQIIDVETATIIGSTDAADLGRRHPAEGH